ncbi:hypoxanthine/guanine phosphoribosyltransferase [Halegenticoccus soli]|uniref:hypoxanthine/guanine phosphoribosyltransferase n=1 Tax=Halegenticoccus soli TaxID=1985678 RepID=UPI000C6E95BE|nr:hypoxanthine/guanine phosphoribosyltransferase [Halegenticoccus soli]
MENLLRSLRDAPVIRRDGYEYVVHPVTDGIPLVEPALLREIARGIESATDLDGVDKIVAPEAMGIHHATALSLESDVPFVVVRKRPYGFDDEVPIHQTTGYAEGELYLNNVREGDRVLVVDDVFATGGTLKAVCGAILDAGAELADVVVVVRRAVAGVDAPELPFEVKSLVEIDVVDGEVVVRS